MTVQVEKITALIREKEKLEKMVEKASDTREWTKITFEGEDGAEHPSSFSIGSPSENNKANLALVKHLHGIMTTHFKQRLKECDEAINDLLK